jgi:hypothetical protein
MARTSPSRPLTSSRKYDKNEFEYVNPESAVTPEFVALMPRGYTPLICACTRAEGRKRHKMTSNFPEIIDEPLINVTVLLPPTTV